ncbi:UNVERIFIED_CONTAM: hypothetical protein Sangu_0117200 [Sesamum angustifolium]|uniref:Uncharacterized protein n=1 Tax=Sesamum angustifolium TaxID=2727405 RepID=A0AAW2RKF8_9LAMI
MGQGGCAPLWGPRGSAPGWGSAPRRVGRRATLPITDSSSPPDHPDYRNKESFTKNRVEWKVTRPRLVREHIHDWVKEFSPAVEVLFVTPREKTKDNLNAQKDLKIICNQSKLEVDERRPNVMPKALYTLTKEQKMRICEWISHLKFPDGYASNLACRVDMKEMRLLA